MQRQCQRCGETYAYRVVDGIMVPFDLRTVHEFDQDRIASLMVKVVLRKETSFGTCDVCGKRAEVHTFMFCGTETSACDGCRGNHV